MYSPEFSKSLEQDFMREKLKAQFDLIFQYQGELSKTKRFLGIDLDNLETLFSILDMDWQASTADIPISGHFPPLYSVDSLREIREAFFSVLIATLKVSIDRKKFSYDSLIRSLADNEQAVFITFNYDTSIEQALQQGRTDKGANEYVVDYGAEINEQINMPPNSRMVLKLHGSANWTHCPVCGKFTPFKDYITPLELVANRHLLHEPNCRETTALNVIIPPTWYKYNYVDVFTRVWNRAIREISFATHIFIIGYSFPRTDVFFEQLLTLALRGSRNLKKVIIINPDPESRDVVKKLFDPHFLSRSVIFHQLRFEELASLSAGRISGEVAMEGFLDRISNFTSNP